MKKGALISPSSPFLTQEPSNNPFHLMKMPFDTNTDTDT